LSELSPQNDLSPDGGKKRPRKSHPQRVVVETDNVGSDWDTDVVMALPDKVENGK